MSANSRLIIRTKTGVVSWFVAIVFAIASLAASLGQYGYVFDLCASLSVQILMVSVLVVVVMILRRRAVQALVVSMGAVVLVSAFPYLRVPTTSDDAAPWVRVLILNTRTTNPNITEIMDLIVRSDASIVVLIEPNAELARSLRDDVGVRALYPTLRMPSRGDPYQVTLCIWPLRYPDDGWHSFSRGRGVVFETAYGPLAFLQLHPRSPRSLADWQDGNHTVLEAIRLAEGEFSGMPVLLGADLNSGPAGSRSRVLARSGFDRSKPVWRASGTFPSWSIWPFQIAIDDVWASGGWRRTSWETVQIPGSDHLGVSVELSLDISHWGTDSR